MITAVNFANAFETVTDYWSPKVVGRVNDQYVKVARLLGEFVWHKHEEEDELFQVVKGRLRLQVEGQPDILLEAGDFCVMPRGTLHKPVAEEECWIVLVETVTTHHTGNVETSRTKSIAAQIG